jgi:hypothetical protein
MSLTTLIRYKLIFIKELHELCALRGRQAETHTHCASIKFTHLVLRDRPASISIDYLEDLSGELRDLERGLVTAVLAVAKKAGQQVL